MQGSIGASLGSLARAGVTASRTARVAIFISPVIDSPLEGLSEECYLLWLQLRKQLAARQALSSPHFSPGREVHCDKRHSGLRLFVRRRLDPRRIREASSIAGSLAFPCGQEDSLPLKDSCVRCSAGLAL
jgi:hypothetical protein